MEFAFAWPRKFGLSAIMGGVSAPSRRRWVRSNEGLMYGRHPSGFKGAVATRRLEWRGEDLSTAADRSCDLAAEAVRRSCSTVAKAFMGVSRCCAARFPRDRSCDCCARCSPKWRQQGLCRQGCPEMGISAPMGSVGDACDNAIGKSFVPSLGCGLIYRRSCDNKCEAGLAVFP